MDREKTRQNLVFVSYELSPVNAGGCGVFLWNAVRKLLSTNHYEITLLLDMPKHECELFKEKHQPSLPNPHLLKIVCLAEILKNVELELDLVDLRNIFLWKSYQFYQGLLYLKKLQHIDYVEFFDYAGVGYYSVRAKRYTGEFSGMVFGIRAHCTIELMDSQQSKSELTHEKLVMYQMEKVAIRDCDVLLAPSNSWKVLYTTRYGISEDRVVISPPPMSLEGIPKREYESSEPNVLFYGRLFQLKGVDVYVDAAVEYLMKHPDSKTKFYLAGYDGQFNSNKTYQQYLLERIPVGLQKGFIFTGQINREQLSEIIHNVQVAVFPNYVESFCYSIHEIYYSGVPIVCRSIPAFEDYFIDGKNSLHFDGTVSDLVHKLEDLLSDSALRDSISYPYPVISHDTFLESYQDFPMQQANNCIGSDGSGSSVSVLLLEDPMYHKISAEERFTGQTYISKERSYVLRSDASVHGSIPVHLFGSTWYCSALFEGDVFDGLLKLERYVWVCRESDNWSPDFLNTAVDILEENGELNYVGAYLSQTNEKETALNRCIPYDLELNFLVNGDLSRAIIRNTADASLKDMFDARLNKMAEWKHLRQKGYIIPRLLVEIMDSGEVVDYKAFSFGLLNTMTYLDVNSLSLVLFQESSSGKKEYGADISRKRILLNKIKSVLDARDDGLSKLLYRLLRFGYRFFKRISTNLK